MLGELVLVANIYYNAISKPDSEICYLQSTEKDVSDNTLKDGAYLHLLYKNYASGIDLNRKLSEEQSVYIFDSEITKNEQTTSVLNIFEKLKKDNDLYDYYYERIAESLEEYPSLFLNEESFSSLQNFIKTKQFSDKRFHMEDFSLQIDDNGKAGLQKTYNNAYVFIEFSANNRILYNIMLNNPTIDIFAMNGTFDAFFEQFEEKILG